MEDTQFWFSPSGLYFLDGDLEDSYRASGAWPEDAREVSTEVFHMHTDEIPSGKRLGVDSEGNPTWVDFEYTVDEQMYTAEYVRERALKELHSEINVMALKAALGEIAEADKETMRMVLQMAEDLKGKEET